MGNERLTVSLREAQQKSGGFASGAMNGKPELNIGFWERAALSVALRPLAWRFVFCASYDTFSPESNGESQLGAKSAIYCCRSIKLESR